MTCAVLAMSLLTPVAGAAVPFKDIASNGPLTHVYLGNELSCQVSHTGDLANELYPPSATPGDCGTFVALGETLYSPDFANHTSSAAGGARGTPFTPVSQTEVSGAGTSSSPYKVTTVVDVGTTGLRITQVDTYVVGQESYRTDVTLQNTSAGNLAGVIYRAGDCFLQGSDRGFGFIDTAHAAAGCSINASNNPPARIEQWFPITTGGQYLEARYSDVWSAVGSRQPFGNTCACNGEPSGTPIDNGAGVTWSFALGPGGSATYSHYTTFSPEGVAGPPPATTNPPTVFGPGGIVVAPPSRRCVSKRHFKIKVRNRPGLKVITAVVFVNGRQVPTYYVKGKAYKTLKGKRIGANVDLRGLPKGTFFVRISAITDTGRTLTGKRKYHTCVPKRRGGKPKL